MRWVIDTGTLHTTEEARTAQQALVRAVRRLYPRSIGKLVRLRKLCCHRRTHGPHFIHYWLDPIQALRRAGLLGK